MNGRVKHSVALWENENGAWTLASEVVRALHSAEDVSSAELYAVLSRLGVTERFSDYWRTKTFYEKAGLSLSETRLLNRRMDGYLAQSGDYAWEDGDEEGAAQLYIKSLEANDSSILAGFGGLFRLRFCQGNHAAAIEAFDQACPPLGFFEEYSRMLDRESQDSNEEHDRIQAKYPQSSPYFVKSSNLMAKCVIVAADRSNAVNDDLKVRIEQYFRLSGEDFEELRAATSDAELVLKLQKRIRPRKPSREQAGMTLPQLCDSADEECVERLCSKIIQAESGFNRLIELLSIYLDSQSAEAAEDYVNAASWFGGGSADSLFFGKALARMDRQLTAKPKHKIFLLRLLGLKFRNLCGDFLSQYTEAMRRCDEEIQPADLLLAFVKTSWWKTPYVTDDTDPKVHSGGFGKRAVVENWSFLEDELSRWDSFPSRADLLSSDNALKVTYAAYIYLKSRFTETLGSERWVSEARLGAALASHFGSDAVQRHARPLWLTPQHLDFLIEDHALAVEYMGIQHYEPIDIFGGAEGLEKTIARDAQKHRLCSSVGIHLEYVRHDEDIEFRARQIFEAFGTQNRSDT